MKNILFTCERNKFLLDGFSHQWHKYYDGEVFVSGLNPYTLPHDFYNMETGNYNLDNWSDQVIDTLEMIDDDLVLFLLDDYWLTREVDRESINLGAKILNKTSAYAFDVSTNSLFDQRKYLGNIFKKDIYCSNNQFAYSYQAYIWKREKLLGSLRREENPWVSELAGYKRMGGDPSVILSFESVPLLYANVMYKGKWDFEGDKVYPKRTLEKEDWSELIKLGYIKDMQDEKIN